MKYKLCFQNYGSSICLFVEGLTPKDAYDKWLSLANWGATSLLNGEEPKYVADNVISCWSTLEQLQRYLFNQHIMKMWDTRVLEFKGKKGGFREAALKAAKDDFDNIATESFRSYNSDFTPFEMGTLEAAKPDYNFVEQCYMKAFAS